MSSKECDPLASSSSAAGMNRRDRVLDEAARQLNEKGV